MTCLARRQATKCRYADLDYEAAAGFEVDRRIGEACDLVVLGGEVADRVEHEVDEAERALDQGAGHVADRHRQLAPPGLPTQLADHRLRQIDSADLDAAPGERQRDPSGPDRKLECSATVRQPRQLLDGRLNPAWIEHLRDGLVVRFSDLGTEMIFTHARIVALGRSHRLSAGRSSR